MSRYVAQIIDDETRKVVRQSEPMSERQAERLASGYFINLNHDRFSVAVADLDDPDSPRMEPNPATETADGYEA